MSDIKFEECAVCHAMDMQWFDYGNSQLVSEQRTFLPCDGVIDIKDFQLNEIMEGDYIAASELDTEQKYNDVVEVFGLFGFHNNSLTGYKGLSSGEYDNLVIRGNGFSNVVINFDCKRQLTYPQIIAIGKLKRMMLERAKSAPKTTPDLTPDLTQDNAYQVKNPKHYQLIEGVESIEIIARSMTKEQWKGFCLGNMLKYRIRAGKKDALQQDIEKANFYGELYEMHKEKCYD